MAISLQNTLEHLEAEIQALRGRTDFLRSIKPNRLSDAVKGIAAAPIHPHSDRLVEAQNRWQSFIQGRAPIPPNSAIRKLFWCPEICQTLKFSEIVLDASRRFGLRELKGIVASLLQAYDTIEKDNSVRLVFERYFEKDWKDCADYLSRVRPFLLQSNARQIFAKLVTERSSTPDEQIRDVFEVTLALNSYSIHTLGIIAATNGLLLASEEHNKRQWFIEKILPLLQPNQLVTAVSAGVMALTQHISPDVRDRFKRLILESSALGDPRVPLKKGNWDSFEIRVVKKVMEWFSADDIHLFFETVFDDKKDTQGRKEFWTRYASSVQRTRVILCEADRRRLAKMLSDGGYADKIIIGVLSGNDSNGSAFIMDFGEVIVVEYSLPNNSCRFHERGKTDLSRKPEDFWKPKFTNTELRTSTHHLIHSPPRRWGSKFIEKLKDYNIWPSRTDYL